MSRVFGMVVGTVFSLPYVALFTLVRLGDLWLSGNLRDVLAVPCNKAAAD